MNASLHPWHLRFVTLALSFFFLVLLNAVVRNFHMFFKKHGRYHVLTGLFYLLWLFVGLLDCYLAFLPRILYDVSLPMLG